MVIFIFEYFAHEEDWFTYFDALVKMQYTMKIDMQIIKNKLNFTIKNEL